MKINDILLESYSDAKRIFSQEENNETVSKYLDIFRDLSKKNIIKGQEKDISYWIKQGWENFKQFVDSNKNVISKTQSKKSKKKDSIIVHESDNVLVVIPLTEQASCYYGKNTKWCTAATKDENKYDLHIRRNTVLYYIIDKNTNKKYAAAYITDQDYFEFYNDKDETISFESFEDFTGISKQQLKGWYNENKSQIEKARKNIVLKFPEYAYHHAVQTGERSDKLEKVIAQNPRYAFRYADKVLKGPFPKGEDAIAQNGEMAFKYAKYVLQEPFPKGEDAIAKLPRFSVDYAITLLKGPFPDAEEEIIKSGGVFAIDYLEEVLDIYGSEKDIERYTSIVTDEATQLKIVGSDPTDEVLRLFQNPSEKVIKKAIQLNGYAIEHVDDPSEEMKWMALEDKPLSIKYIDGQTEEMKQYAMNNAPLKMVFPYLENPSRDVMMKAIKRDPYLIKYIPHDEQWEELQIEAIERDSKTNDSVVKYMGDMTEKAQAAAVRFETDNYQYINNPTDLIKNHMKRLGKL